MLCLCLGTHYLKVCLYREDAFARKHVVRYVSRFQKLGTEIHLRARLERYVHGTDAMYLNGTENPSNQYI